MIKKGPNESNINNESLFDDKAFPDKLSKDVFNEWLKINSDISPRFVTRKDFNDKKGEFLVLNGEGRYDLFLPNDIKISELPKVIFKVNKLTFGDDLPEYSSIKELQTKIVINLDLYLKRLSDPNIKRDEEKLTKKAIKNYVKLYEQLVGTDKASKLSNLEYRNSIIIKSKGNSRISDYAKRITKLKTSELIDNLKDEILAHTNESFFEKGISDLGDMQTFTKEDYRSLKKKEDKGEYTDENLSFHTAEKDLDDSEQILRDKIGIDDYKNELDLLRKEGDLEKIAKKELEIVNKVLKTIYEYPWQMKDMDGGFPAKIKELKKVYCVGFSNLGHSFFQDLGIEHKVITLPYHSAVDISIGGKNYYFDGANFDMVFPFHYSNNEGIYKDIIIGFDNLNIGKRSERYILEDKLDKIDLKGYSGDSEKVLQGQILLNKGIELIEEKKYYEAISFLKKSLRYNKKNYDTYINLSRVYYYIKNKDISLKYSSEAIKIDPSRLEGYFKLGLYHSLDKNYNKGMSYIDKSLKLNPNFHLLWSIKGKIYKYLGDNVMKKLCSYIGETLGGKHSDLQFVGKDDIDKFIDSKDYDGLVSYIGKIEKESKS